MRPGRAPCGAAGAAVLRPAERPSWKAPACEQATIDAREGLVKHVPVDALLELADLLEASGAEENARSFVLQVICELLPEDRQDSLLTGPQAERRGNVIDFLRRKQQV